jgi:hypothetical protein
VEGCARKEKEHESRGLCLSVGGRACGPNCGKRGPEEGAEQGELLVSSVLSSRPGGEAHPSGILLILSHASRGWVGSGVETGSWSTR